MKNKAHHLFKLCDGIQGRRSTVPAGAGRQKLIEEGLCRSDPGVLLAKEGGLVRAQGSGDILPHHGRVSPGGEPGVVQPRHVNEPRDVLCLIMECWGPHGIIQDPHRVTQSRWGRSQVTTPLEELAGGPSPSYGSGHQVLHPGR